MIRPTLLMRPSEVRSSQLMDITATDFKYPEFIELKWDDLTELRQIEITTDSSTNSFPLLRPQ